MIWWILGISFLLLIISPSDSKTTKENESIATWPSKGIVADDIVKSMYNVAQETGTMKDTEKDCLQYYKNRIRNEILELSRTEKQMLRDLFQVYGFPSIYTEVNEISILENILKLVQDFKQGWYRKGVN